MLVPGWFSEVEWSSAPLPPLSWLLREMVAIFSLVLLKCGCKKLLVHLASSSTEKGGTAASDSGGPPHRLPQPASHISEARRSRLASGISLLPAASQFPCCWGWCLCRSLKHIPSLKCFDRALNCFWAWSSIILETWDRMGHRPASLWALLHLSTLRLSWWSLEQQWWPL